MPISPLRRFVATLALLLTAAPLLAWNDSGHTTLGVAIYRELTPETRAKVDEILRAHPRYEADLLENYAGDPNDAAAKAEHAFAKAGVWPDMVRNRSNPAHAVHHRSNWHYTDIPFHPFGGEDRFIGEPARPLRPGEPWDSISAWEYNLARFHDESLPLADRAVALCWVLHIGGDCHQPCHNMSMYSEEHPTGDRGANEWMVLYRGQRRNLHSIWDGWIGDDRSLTFARDRASQITTLHPRESFSAELAEKDIRQWVAANARLAIQYVYHFGMINYPTRAEADANRDLPLPVISDAYAQAATALSLRQAALATYRTADALNSPPTPRN